MIWKSFKCLPVVCRLCCNVFKMGRKMYHIQIPCKTENEWSIKSLLSHIPFIPLETVDIGLLLSEIVAETKFSFISVAMMRKQYMIWTTSNRIVLTICAPIFQKATTSQSIGAPPSPSNRSARKVVPQQLDISCVSTIWIYLEVEKNKTNHDFKFLMQNLRATTTTDERIEN